MIAIRGVFFFISSTDRDTAIEGIGTRFQKRETNCPFGTHRTKFSFVDTESYILRKSVYWSAPLQRQLGFPSFFTVSSFCSHCLDCRLGDLFRVVMVPLVTDY